MKEIKKEIIKRIHTVPVDNDFTAVREEYIIDNKIIQSREFIILNTELKKLDNWNQYKIKDILIDETGKHNLIPYLVDRNFEENWRSGGTDFFELYIQDPYTKLKNHKEDYKDIHVVLFSSYDEFAYRYTKDNKLINCTVTNINNKRIVPIPKAFHCDYINCHIDNCHYDLKKLSEYLLSNPDKFKIQYHMFDKDCKNVIQEIPYYNRQNGYEQTIQFTYMPTDEEYFKYYTEYKYMHGLSKFFEEILLKDFLINE